MNDKGNKFKKIDDFIKEIQEVIKKGSSFEEERYDISSKVIGFIRGVFGDSREDDYRNSINEGLTGLEKDAIVFDKKCKQMISFLNLLKEEIEARAVFHYAESKNTFSGLKKSVEKNRLESERRKNVAEFKYWGFAIELIDNVRKELKDFKHIQENLLESINELKKELKEYKSKK